MPAGDPVYTSDTTTIAQSSSTKPLVRLVQQTAQSCPSNSTIAVTFAGGSEVVDTHNFHDTATNNTRVTPTVAGWYSVSGKVVFGARTDFKITDCSLRVNGATAVAGSSGRTNAPTFSGTNSTTSAVQTVMTGETLISFNGSSDYVELLAVQTNVAAADPSTSATAQFASTLQLRYERPL